MVVGRVLTLLGLKIGGYDLGKVVFVVGDAIFFLFLFLFVVVKMEWRCRRMESRSDELYHVLCEKGYPDDFCREIAYRQMNTDYTATRMLGYLYRVSDPRPEDVVDEMLAILTDREAIIKKKELEHAQATINHVYREGL